ncbi:MAG: hypothetical protein RSC24_06675 [Clostridium sp.]
MAGKTKTDVKEKVVKTKAKSPVKKQKVVDVDNSDVIAMLMKQVAELTEQLGKQSTVVNTETVKKKEIQEPDSKKKKRATFKDIKDDEVLTERVIAGIGDVKYIDKKTGDEYLWPEEGSTEYLTVDTLKRMIGRSPTFLKEPWIKIVDNEDAIEVLGLKDLYRKIEAIDDINSIIEMSDNELYDIINGLSRGYRETLATNIMSKVSSGELTNILVIRRLERILDKEFMI